MEAKLTDFKADAVKGCGLMMLAPRSETKERKNEQGREITFSHESGTHTAFVAWGLSQAKVKPYLLHEGH